MVHQEIGGTHMYMYDSLKISTFCNNTGNASFFLLPNQSLTLAYLDLNILLLTAPVHRLKVFEEGKPESPRLVGDFLRHDLDACQSSKLLEHFPDVFFCCVESQTSQKYLFGPGAGGEGRGEGGEGEGGGGRGKGKAAEMGGERRGEGRQREGRKGEKKSKEGVRNRGRGGRKSEYMYTCAYNKP